MGSKVVSTKLSEEEYGKLVGLCSVSGDTVSKLLKRAILARMNEELGGQQRSTKKEIVREKPQVIKKPKLKQVSRSEDRFLYY